MSISYSVRIIVNNRFSVNIFARPKTLNFVSRCKRIFQTVAKRFCHLSTRMSSRLINKNVWNKHQVHSSEPYENQQSKVGSKQIFASVGNSDLIAWRALDKVMPFRRLTAICFTATKTRPCSVLLGKWWLERRSTCSIDDMVQIYENPNQWSS